MPYQKMEGDEIGVSDGPIIWRVNQRDDSELSLRSALFPCPSAFKATGAREAVHTNFRQTKSANKKNNFIGFHFIRSQRKIYSDQQLFIFSKLTQSKFTIN